MPTGEDRPIAIEVDGPSHFYANSKRYTAYTKLKHRLLTRMGYKVLHVPYYEWRSLRGAVEREDYMRKKLKEEPTEWLDPEDEKYYTQGPDEGEDEFSVKPEASTHTSKPDTAAWPATPNPPPPRQAQPQPTPSQPSQASQPPPPPTTAMPPTPPAPPQPPRPKSTPPQPPGPPQPPPGSEAFPSYPKPPRK